MTHPLTYTGIGVEALLDAAKYDPPSADLVKALADALSESLVEWENEISDMRNEIDTLESEKCNLEIEIEQFKTGDTE